MRNISNKNQSIDIDKLLQLSQEIKRLERMIEEQTTQMYSDSSGIIDEVKRGYPEGDVQRAAYEVEDILGQIRKDSKVIYDKLHEQNKLLNSIAGQYISDEEKLKQLVRKPQVKFSVRGSSNSLFTQYNERVIGDAFKLQSPIEMVKSLLTKGQEVSLTLRLSKFKDDERIGMYLELLETGSLEKQQFAREQLTAINEALVQIARNQTAYGLYSKYGNPLYMEEVHIEAEKARAELAELGVAEKWYAADVSLISHYVGSPLDACQYNPLKQDRSAMPTLDELRFFLLVGSRNEWLQGQLREQYDRMEKIVIAADQWRTEVKATLEEYNQSTSTAHIEMMQQFLKDKHLYEGEVTGTYSLALLTAVQQYQTQYNESERATQLQYTSEVDGKIDNKLINLVYMDRGLIGETQGELDMCYAPEQMVEDTRNGFQKSLDSIGEIGSDFVAAAVDRSNKAWDSPGDFLNYLTSGIPKGIYDAAFERAEKRKDSVFDYLDYLSIGFAGTVRGTFNPQEGALSKEHWMNSFGLASLLAAPIQIKMKTSNTTTLRNNAVSPIEKATPAELKKQDDIEIKTQKVDEVKPLKDENLAESSRVEGTGDVGKVVPPPKTVISPEMETKILEGQRKIPKNDLIGGHSPSINNANDIFVVEVLSTNADGTKNVVFTKQFPDGNISKLKRSTLFPDSWSDEQILKNITDVGNTPTISTRIRDGATWHRAL
ncbi:hypothetical protein J2T13_002884 [Paenibacillus sp. DS2015]|uniref:EndoU domain-containing protein n=1 Tax=Paenibacillus sp. DS2015 TaxID=3373917 RepID=UPI003D198134